MKRWNMCSYKFIADSDTREIHHECCQPARCSCPLNRLSVYQVNQSSQMKSKVAQRAFLCVHVSEEMQRQYLWKPIRQAIQCCNRMIIDTFSCALKFSEPNRTVLSAVKQVHSALRTTCTTFTINNPVMYTSEDTSHFQILGITSPHVHLICTSS